MTRLVVVTLLLAIVAVVLKSRTKGTKSNRTIRVTSRVTINRGAMVAVVEVDGRRLLVGASATQVNLLSELGEGDDLPDDGTDPASGTPLGTTLAGRLAALRTRPSTRSTSASTSTDMPTGAATATSLVRVDEPTTLVEKIRGMTARTAEPKLRLPQRPGGAT